MAVLHAFADALATVAAIPEWMLRNAEADWRLEAFDCHYDPATEAMTPEGDDLRERAATLDLFLARRPFLA